LEFRCGQIRRLGGTVTVGPSPAYGDPTFARHFPTAFRAASQSRVLRWCRQQFPVVYGVDLREVHRPEDVETALQVALTFGHLRELTLFRSGVTDDQLRLTAGFPRLARLKISETSITDKGIQHLRGHPTLELVNAQSTSITDAAVPDLAAIPRLKELLIGNTGITSVQPIRAAHPNCNIQLDFVYATRCHTCMQLLNECRCVHPQDRRD
jgi:hypothetical protein